MKKINQEKGIKTLDKEIKVVQIDEFVNNFEKSMKKEVKERLKRLLYALIPLSSVLGLVFFPSSITFLILISVVLTIGVITVNQLIETKGLFKKGAQTCFNNSLLEKQKPDLILEKGIGKKKSQDFHQKGYLEAINRVKSEQEIKYEETLERQQQKGRASSHLELANNKEDFLNKEETMVQIIREMDAYCAAYNLPPLVIENKDWDIYFDTLYETFVSKGKEAVFYKYMSEIGRVTFSKALINNQTHIKINHFIANLDIWETSNDNVLDSSWELLSLQKTILAKLESSKVIDLNDYKRRKGK